MKNQFKSISKIFLFAVFTSALFISCEDDGPKGAYADGAYIVNEGAFSNNNGSISFYNYGSDEVTNNIFQLVNERELGDVVQSINAANGKAFIVVNNSNKIEVVDQNTFESIGTVPDLPAPRYTYLKNSVEGFVTCWNDNTVKVLNLETLSVTKSIAMGAGPEKMIATSDKLFIANSGGFSVDSTIFVVDIETHEVTDTIVVGNSPRDMVIDKNGNIWVLCFGKVIRSWDPPYGIVEETPSMLYKVNSTNNSVIASVELYEKAHPTQLEIDNDGETLYYGGSDGFNLGTGIFSAVETENALNVEEIVKEIPYGFNYDTGSGKLFVGYSTSFTDAGILKRFETDGTELGTYSVGIGPNGAGFKRTK